MAKSADAENSPVIPANETDVTAEWFSSVTGIEIGNPSTFRILPNPNAGVGNLSQMIRVGFSTWKDGDYKATATTETESSFFIKLLPIPTNDFERGVLEVIISEHMDTREVFFYKTLKAELERVVPELRKYFVECPYATKNDSGSAVILQDMNPEGYWMPGFADGLRSAFFDKSLHFIAQLHLAGELLQLEHRDRGGLPTFFPRLNTWHVPRPSSTVSLIEQFPSLDWFAVGLEFLAANLVPTSDADLFRALIPHTEKIIRWIIDAGGQSPTIIHDDLWPHNFLCHDNGGLKVIDWQLIGFTDPTYELINFLMSSLPLEKIDNETVLEGVTTYYKIKEELYQTKQMQMSKTLEEFLEFFKMFGYSYGFLCVTMSADSIYATEAYRPKLAKIFSYFCDAGIPQMLLNKHGNN